MRVLVVLFAVVWQVTAFNNPRVKLFDQSQDLVASRSEALQLCISKGHCIAHDSQIIADIQDGYTGHHRCGFTWDSQDGKPRHAHCTQTDPDNSNKCMPGKSSLRNDACPKAEKFGVYCRVSRPGEDLPHPCKVEDSDLVEIFRIKGPFWNVPQAVAGCTKHGAELAYFSQVASHVDRYDVQWCQYNIMRVDYAVYKVNCKHSGKIDWNIVDGDGPGYGALCRGQRPHEFEKPCNKQYPVIAGTHVYCDEGGWVIMQDRPACTKEKNHFSGRTWSQYRNGFGSLDPTSEKFGGYWLGLQPAHTMCSQHKCRVRFEMFDENDKFYFAEYDSFKLGSENQGIYDELGRTMHYKLNLGTYALKSTAPNALQAIQDSGGRADGSYFSLGHRDGDDNSELRCAEVFDSGWWFSSCHRGNLNGICSDEAKYKPAESKSRYWSGVANAHSGLKRTRIKLKIKDDFKDDDSITTGV